MANPFRAGDRVKHRPSGETWILCCDERNGRVAPCGWPESYADALDCELIERANHQVRVSMLRLASTSSGPRGSWAKAQLESLEKVGFANG